MSKQVSINQLFQGQSGRIGSYVLRNINGQTYISVRPKKRDHSSPLQQQQMSRFQLAIKWANEHKHDPEFILAAQLDKRNGINSYNLAIKKALSDPTILAPINVQTQNIAPPPSLTITTTKSPSNNYQLPTTNSHLSTFKTSILPKFRHLATSTLIALIILITTTFSACTKKQPIAVEAISLSLPTLTLLSGSSDTLTVTISPADAENKLLTWLSRNEAVATVKDGIISTNPNLSQDSSTYIIVFHPATNLKDSCLITVKAKPAPTPDTPTEEPDTPEEPQPTEPKEDPLPSTIYELPEDEFSLVFMASHIAAELQTTFHWDFGDGTTASTTDPGISHEYPHHAATYTVKVKYEYDGKSYAASKTINIEGPLPPYKKIANTDIPLIAKSDQQFNDPSKIYLFLRITAEVSNNFFKPQKGLVVYDAAGVPKDFQFQYKDGTDPSNYENVQAGDIATLFNLSPYSPAAGFATENGNKFTLPFYYGTEKFALTNGKLSFVNFVIWDTSIDAFMGRPSWCRTPLNITVPTNTYDKNIHRNIALVTIHFTSHNQYTVKFDGFVPKND